MTIKSKHNFPAVAAALLALTALPGCFTGIERTATIKADSDSRKSAQVSPEQELMKAVRPQLPSLWPQGKVFIVAGGRPELAFTPSSEASALALGDTLRFIGVGGAVRLSGDSVTDVSFQTPGGKVVTHRVEISPSRAMSGDALTVPFTVEADVVDQARQALTGRTLWTLRADARGRKFAKVKVKEVIAGSPDYPLTVILENGDSIKMVTESRSATGRTFANLFALSDPRKLYPTISDEHWLLIADGKIAEGMTRQECRLALGAPGVIDRETAFNGLIERWTYENGIYLYFTDGILTSFRR